MTVKMYKNYGVLAHEYTPVYSYVPSDSGAYDLVSIEVPDEYEPYKNEYDEVLIWMNIKGERVPVLLADALTQMKFDRKCTIAKLT